MQKYVALCDIGGSVINLKTTLEFSLTRKYLIIARGTESLITLAFTLWIIIMQSTLFWVAKDQEFTQAFSI